MVWEWIPCSDCQLSSFSKAKAVCTITPVHQIQNSCHMGPVFVPPESEVSESEVSGKGEMMG